MLHALLIPVSLHPLTLLSSSSIASMQCPGEPRHQQRTGHLDVTPGQKGLKHRPEGGLGDETRA